MGYQLPPNGYAGGYGPGSTVRSSGGGGGGSYYGYTPQGFQSGDPTSGGNGGGAFNPGNYRAGYGGNYQNTGTGAYSGPLFTEASLQSMWSYVTSFVSNNWFVLLVIAAVMFALPALKKAL